jgi:hypothetical protein
MSGAHQNALGMRMKMGLIVDEGDIFGSIHHVE